jgi:MOSC domain-containing protein YiiM
MTPDAARILAVAVVHQLLPAPGSDPGITAIDKRAVTGAVQVHALGVSGDRQCDTTNHGGGEQAVYAYAQEDADWWAGQLGRQIPVGLFGENLRTAGLAVTGAEIGEQWQVGEGPDPLLLEVTSPRTPCQKFQRRMGEPHWVKRFTRGGAPGAYLRVLNPGPVCAGDPVLVVRRPGHGVTIGDTFPRGAPAPMRRLLTAADSGDVVLAPDMRHAATLAAARG